MAYSRIPNVTVYDESFVNFKISDRYACKFEQIDNSETVFSYSSLCGDYFPYTWRAREGSYKLSYTTSQGGAWVEDSFEVYPKINYVEIDNTHSANFIQYLHDSDIILFSFLSIAISVLLFTIFLRFFNRQV